MEQHRTALREKRDSLNKKNDNKRRSSNHKPEDFTPGDSVYVISFDSEGTVLSKADSKGRINVQIGMIQSRLPATDLVWQEKPREPEISHERNVLSTSNGISRASNFKPEINVLGLTVDEAVTKIDKFLDDALMSHATSVTIIHGKGTGALRRGIHEYLKKHPSVSSFRAGEFGEGDSGVTVVEF
jgi:DNA mismatch repair protein MutS2